MLQYAPGMTNDRVMFTISDSVIYHSRLIKHTFPICIMYCDNLYTIKKNKNKTLINGINITSNK